MEEQAKATEILEGSLKRMYVESGERHPDPLFRPFA